MKTIIGCLITAFTMLMTIPVYAGEINGNEQSVVSVIHGQFEKDGVIYGVSSEYISSAMDYLRQDDVNLSPADAKSVIAEIYANVQTGVESGYLREIGRKEPQKPIADERNMEETLPTDEAGESANHTLTTDEAPKPPTETQASIPAETQASIPTEISILELVDKIPTKNYDYIRRDTDDRMQSMGNPHRILPYVVAGLCALLFWLFLVCTSEKCWMREHHRKLRRFLRLFLGLELGTVLLCIELIAGLWMGAYHESAVLNRMDETGYYQTIYGELEKETEISFALLDIPDSVMEDAVSYERVVMAARQQVENDLKQGNYQAKTTLLTDHLKLDMQNYLEEQSIALTPKAEIGLELLIERLDEKYEHLLRWPYSSWWAQNSQSFDSYAKPALGILMGLLAWSTALILWMHHDLHRGIRQCGWVILGTSLGLSLIGGVLFAGKMIQPPTMEPLYMSQFFYLYEQGIVMVTAMLGVIGILIGISILLLARYRKEGDR
ncbi:MAG: hypothetical protein RR466_12265 [Hungatella sp.]